MIQAWSSSSVTAALLVAACAAACCQDLADSACLPDLTHHQHKGHASTCSSALAHSKALLVCQWCLLRKYSTVTSPCTPACTCSSMRGQGKCWTEQRQDAACACLLLH